MPVIHPLSFDVAHLLAGSLVLIPVYVFYSQQRWLVVAFIIGVITGVEMITNANRPEHDSLTRQNLVFGAAYVVCAVFTFFFVLYKR